MEYSIADRTCWFFTAVTGTQFPKDPVIRENWRIFCGNTETWRPTRTSAICSEHFTLSSFKELANNRRKLVEGAIPTLNNTVGAEEPPVQLLKSTITKIAKTTPPIATEEVYFSSFSQSIPLSTQSPSPAISQSLQSHSNSLSNSQPSATYSQCIPTTTTSVSELIETPRKRKLRKQLQFKNKKNRRLQAKTRYLKKKVNTLQEQQSTTITHNTNHNNLEERSLIDKEDKLVLSKIGVTEKELLKRQMKKSDKLPRTKYSLELRSFALTLHYYSAKAYKYVRKVFQTCLPHPRTLCKWYSNIDGQPGFTKESLFALKLRAEQIKNKIYCALVFDEMKIKLYPEWDPRTKRYFGYVNHGFESISDSSDKATDALVLLLVGINTIFRVPMTMKPSIPGCLVKTDV